MHRLSTRLETFQGVVPGGGRGRKKKWPHKTPGAAALAKAGFFYQPVSTSSDLVVCFLCEKSLDGWEAGDDPLQEHLSHSPDCCFALLLSDGARLDPAGRVYVDARAGTFGEHWPHEHKRGWKPKTRSLAEAGFYYAPTTSSDDMVSCAFCDLGLDGWEAKDDPEQEHRARRPACVMFTAMPASGHESAACQTAKSRKAPAKRGRKPKAVAAAAEKRQALENENFETSPPERQTKRRNTRSSTNQTKTTRLQRKKPSLEEAFEDVDSPKSVVQVRRSARLSRGALQSVRMEPALAQPPTITAIPEERSSPLRLQPSAQATPRMQAASPVKGMFAANRRPLSPERQPTSCLPSPLKSQLSTLASPIPRLHASRDLRTYLTVPDSSTSSRWRPVDITRVLKPVASRPGMPLLSERERAMTVEEWMRSNTAAEADWLEREGERIVQILQSEGERAKRLVETIIP